MKCIWCLTDSKAIQPEEHIIPDSIGCPDDLVFRNGEVCGRCNNQLAKLDQSIISEFGMFKFMAGVPNKRGKPPEISTWPAIHGFYTREGKPHIDLNLEKTPRKGMDGRGLGPYRKGERGLTFKVHDTADGPTVQIRQDG